MVTLLILLFLVLLLIGMPVAFAMAISGAIIIIGLENVNPVIVPQRMFMSLNSFPFLAIPFFILTGELMNTGGITKRIIKFSSVLVGHLPGNLAHINVLTNMIMAGFSGSATADAVAIGSIMIPAMKEESYPPEFSAGLTAAASCIGPIIPPSVTMVLYGGITGLSVGAMFLGGIIPGIVIGLFLMALVAYYAKKNQWPKGEKSTFKKIYKAFFEVFWALLAPIIIVGGIVTGMTTATEAGVIAAVYAFFVGTFIYKEISISQIPDILIKASINTAVPMIIIAGASLFGWVLARQNFASAITNSLLSITNNPEIIFLLIIGLLFLIGMFVEGTAALLIFVPILFPLGNQLGYDPIHFALAIIITILIGTVTPPVGLQLYIAASIADVPISKVVIWPFVAVMMCVVLLIVYFPTLVTYLPTLFFH